MDTEPGGMRSSGVTDSPRLMRRRRRRACSPMAAAVAQQHVVCPVQRDGTIRAWIEKWCGGGSEGVRGQRQGATWSTAILDGVPGGFCRPGSPGFDALL